MNSPSIRLIKLFEERYGHTPALLSSAPGRVNMLGEHTDYNDGFVLPIALDLRTTVLLSPRNDHQVHAYSTAMDQGCSFKLDHTHKSESATWAIYLHGISKEYIAHGYDISGFNILIHSDVPIGAGLSSSASLEVALAYAIESLSNRKLGHLERAMLCQRAERVWVGVPCGIMDQAICSQARAGHALFIDCRNYNSRQIPFATHEVSILLVNSGIQHHLADSEYKNRTDQCRESAELLGISSLREASLQLLDTKSATLGPLLYRRARHVVTENLRTINAVDAMINHNWEHLGSLMYASHNSLRNDYEVSCPETDSIVEQALEITPDGGVYGARMTGAGFGGCVIILARRDRTDSVSDIIADKYRILTGKTPDIYISRPSPGVSYTQITTGIQNNENNP